MRFVGIILVLLIGWIETAALKGQAPIGSFQLAAIQTAGAKRYSQEDVAKLSGLKIGQSITVRETTSAAERLGASGMFKSVQFRYATTARQLTVAFTVEEEEWTVPVTFDNFVWFTEDEVTNAVKQDVPTFDGTLPAREGAPDLVVHALQKLLESKKVPGRANLVPQADLKQGKLQYLFNVQDPAPKLCAVAFTGVSAAPEGELLETSRPAIGKEYSRFYLMSMSRGTWLDVFHRRGYWRASFSQPAVAVNSLGCAGVAVTMPVTEGSVYAFEKADWSGNSVIGSAELDAALGMKSGEIADSSKLDAGVVRVRQAYGQRGYLFAAVAPIPKLNDASSRAVFEMRVEEGPQFHMGDLGFVGLSEGDANRLKKNWKMAAGAPYDDSYAQGFVQKEIVPLLPAGAQRPLVRTEIDREKHIVAVKIVFER